ncbi:winged helix-turn-helix domain-containing protein [uncultured Shewanella sp.]|uniref:winged helix-turn-helix domain-containing protein n=1 Tax=uncultured Shewanella sp. TaxID=173975 RepID=UPI0026373299|nr:winged helix-turn-helix domain-containing protein [uncultured Shewanella sp.]
MNISKCLTIDLESRELVDHKVAQRHPLTLAEFEVLKCLVNHIGEVVSKETLNEAGWPNRVVAPSSLTQCMSCLRRKLGAHDEVELKNIPRYGYSLCIKDTDEKGNPEPAEPSDIGNASIKVGHFSRYWRWFGAALFVALLAGLHFSGKLKQTVNYLALLTEPGVASILDAETELDGQKIQLSQLRLEDQPDEQRSAAHFIGNWSNTDKIFGNELLKRIFANDNARYESVALCNQYDGECKDTQPLNLVRERNTYSPLDLQWLSDTKLRMEQVTYNKILLDKFDNPPEGLVEDIYRADVYYYGASKNVVRADVRLSLVYQSPARGTLVMAACITDDMLRHISMRYQFSGEFKMQQKTVDGQLVKSFLLDTGNVSFTSPDEISEESATIYREIRKSVLSNETQILRQVYQDANSGVWMLPLWGDTMVWAHRVEVTL